MMGKIVFKLGANEEEKELPMACGNCCIPVSSKLGFKTVSVFPAVFNQIEDYNLQDESCIEGTSDKNFIPVDALGVLLGKKKDANIEIMQSMPLNSNMVMNNILTVNNIIGDKNFSNGLTLEFLGVYSYGNIPTDLDIKILRKIFGQYKSSLFLLKFTVSQKSKILSATIFESVPCLCRYMGRLYFIQLNSYAGGHISNRFNKEIPDMEMKVFYIDYSKQRKITDADEEKIKGIAKRLIKEKYCKKTVQFKGKDSVELLKELEQTSNFEITYNFKIDIEGSGKAESIRYSCLVPLFNGSGVIGTNLFSSNSSIDSQLATAEAALDCLEKLQGSTVFAQGEARGSPWTLPIGFRLFEQKTNGGPSLHTPCPQCETHGYSLRKKELKKLNFIKEMQNYCKKMVERKK